LLLFQLEQYTMLSSFAGVAFSLWLAFFAVACLRRLWPASTSDGNGYAGRDYSRGAGSENHYRHRDLGSEGLISMISLSLIAVSHALTNIIRAALSRSTGWISKTFRRAEIPLPSANSLSTIAPVTANGVPESPPATLNNEPAKTDPTDQRAGVFKKKRATVAVKQTSETRPKLSQPQQRKTKMLKEEKDIKKASKSRKDHAVRRSRKANDAGANAGNRTGRAKPKVSVASRTSLAPKTSV
jgi:hypothetical protein